MISASFIQPWFLFAVIFLVGTLFFGYWITLIESTQIGRIFGWGLLIISTASIFLVTRPYATPLQIMVLIILALLFSVKAIVSVESVYAKKGRLPFLSYLYFSMGWLGMRPYIFHTIGNKALSGSGSYFFQGFRNASGGTILLFAGSYIFDYSPIASTTLLMVGLSLIVHFGAIPVQAGFWRLFGVNTQLLFKEPYQSKTLAEFWGHRWNLAFSEMTSIVIFRPLKKVIAPQGALWISFLLSGIFHDLAISVPVGKGYGWPTLFFLIQALGISLEQAKWFNLLSNFKKRIWTFFWLITPVPILFHIHFVKDILWATLIK